MNDEKNRDALEDEIIEAIMNLDEKSLREEFTEDGLSLSSAAADVRSTLLAAVSKHQKNERIRLIELREEKLRSFSSPSFVLPDLPADRLAMLRDKLAANTNNQRMTAQFRNLDELTDEEVTSALQDLLYLESSEDENE